MPDTQVYRFFLDSPPSDPFLFIVRLEPQLRPKVGDSISGPLTFQNFRIMRDEIIAEFSTRITDAGDVRRTDNSKIRVVIDPNAIVDPSRTTHNYFITPANNPQRISSYTTSRFDNDQTLRQLFR